MRHPEWFGNHEHVWELMKKAGLLSSDSEQKIAMRMIIKHRYIDMMNTVEAIMTLLYEDNIPLSRSTYYRLFKSAVDTMEKYET